MQREKKGLSIFFRLLLSFLGVVILISSALTAVFYFHNKRSVEKHATEYLLQQFEAVNFYLRIAMQGELLNDIRILSSNPIVDAYLMSSEVEKEINVRAVERLFLESLKYTRNYDSVYFVDARGQESARVDRTGRVRRYRNMSRSGLFRKIESGPPGNIRFSIPDKDASGRVFFSIGIYKIDADYGKFGGAVIVDYNLHEVLAYFDKIRIFDENPVWVFDPNGRVLKQPDGKTARFDPRPFFSSGIQATPRLFIMDEGLLVYRDFLILPEKPLLRLAISIPSSLLLKDLRTIVRFFVAVFFGALFIISIIAYYLARYFSRPIMELADAAVRLANGDRTAQVEVKATGEVQMLADSFNRLYGDLEKTTVSKKTLQTILDSMPYGIVIIDNEKKILNANNAALTLMGYETEDQIAGMVCYNTLCPSGKDKCPVLDLKQTLDRSEIIVMTKDGRRIPVLKTVVPLELDGKDVLLEAVVDITDRKRAEEELTAFAEKLRQRNQELQDFTYIASHDLQEPLRKITSFGDRLKVRINDALDEQGRDYLERMLNAATRMQTLINGLLMYSRISTKEQSFEPVDLAVVVKEVLSDLEVRIEQVQGRVEVGSLAVINADPLQMRQLFQNLIGNALKFHNKSQPPIVTISGSFIPGLGSKKVGLLFDEECYQINIQDNGIGFDEKHADGIFGVFQRLHGKSEYEGSGVGLAICKKIVERHGGDIVARSAPGRGATFVVTLPVKQRKRGDA